MNKPISSRVEIVQCDITTLPVDAIINASDTILSGGGGVDKAIHEAAGPKLKEACQALGECQTGEAKVTPGFDLPAKWVIHTAGPIWQGGLKKEKALLSNCYKNILEIAQKKEFKTIAFPAISAGIYGFPPCEAAKIAIRETCSFLKKNTSLEKVLLVCFNEKVLKAHQTAFLKYR